MVRPSRPHAVRLQIADESASLEPLDLYRAGLAVASYNNLALVYQYAGKRAESLATYRQGVITANRTPMEGISSTE